ncbi:uncharacterized protein LOC144107459 isoform X2 [Amblyomma americanum]
MATMNGEYGLPQRYFSAYAAPEAPGHYDNIVFQCGPPVSEEYFQGPRPSVTMLDRVGSTSPLMRPPKPSEFGPLHENSFERYDTAGDQSAHDRCQGSGYDSCVIRATP